METEVLTTEPYQDFLFAMNSPVTRERYSTRLRSFFAFIGIEGTTMDERCRRFVEKVKESEEMNGNTVNVRKNRWDILFLALALANACNKLQRISRKNDDIS